MLESYSEGNDKILSLKCIYTKIFSNEISAKPSQAKIVHIEGRVNKFKFIRSY